MEWQPFFPKQYDSKFKLHDEKIEHFYDNFKYNEKSLKPILIVFAGGSGGGFLANSLSFSDKVSSGIENKLEYVLKKLENMDVIWDDFHLNNTMEDNKYFLILDHPKPLDKSYVPGCHRVRSFPYYHLKYWKNPTVILFKNTKLFCELRRCVWDVDGEIIIGSSLYNEKPFIKSLEKSKNFKKYNDFQEKYSFCNIKTKIHFYIWDTNWYLSLEDTIENLKKLYQILDLGEFDEESITEYYNAWINKIDYLKTIKVF